MESLKILITDDEKAIRDSLSALFENHGYICLTAPNGHIGLEIFSKERPDIVIADLKMPEMQTSEIIRHISEISPDTPIIILSETGEIKDAVQALQLGAWDYLIKPVEDRAILIHRVNAAMEKSRLLRENRESRGILEKMVAEKTRELEEANLAARESAEILKKAQQIAKMGHWEWNIKNDSMFLSEELCNLYGIIYSEENWNLEDIIDQVIHPDDRDKIKRVAAEVKIRKVEKPSEFRIIKPDGSIRWMETSSPQTMRRDENGRPVSFMGVVCDITEHKNAQEQLAQTRKMDAIGHLAGGISHDFNNMLSGIIGAAEMLKISIEETNELPQKLISLIIEAAERASDLTVKLLTFSRKNPIERALINANETVKAAVALLERSIDKKIQISMNLESKKSTVLGDFSQLQNIFLNLGINSSHAMPSGGSLCFASRDITLDSNMCNELSFEIHPGNYVEISVSDSGCGIPAEHISKIFEPFFTTKEEGKGTGLGLAAVYGTVLQHLGAITVNSEEGKGSVFSIFLPVSEESPEGLMLPPDSVYGSGNILLVDDEETIRSTAKIFLEQMGYHVILAENGRQAMEIFNTEHQKIDLVILDMIMPEMNGSECLSAMKKIAPKVRVIFSTGFVNEKDSEKLKNEGAFSLILKPYRYSELSNLVAEALAKHDSFYNSSKV